MYDYNNRKYNSKYFIFTMRKTRNGAIPFNLGVSNQWTKPQLQNIIPGITLKPLQTAIINCLKNHNVLVNLPTGFGKSLLYQYISILSRKITLVVVPLRSLLHDSILQARKLSITACQFSENNIPLILDQKIKLAFVTPQRIFRNSEVNNTIGVLVENKKIQMFVIDQAHCVCEWGNDFRPDYLKLQSIRQSFPSIRVLAMTATAPPHIRNQLLQKLHLRNCYFFFSSFNRPNLTYSVIETTKTKLPDEIIQVIQQFPEQSGIIYCQTIGLCNKMYEKLKDKINCSVFHSQVPALQREALLVDFKNQRTVKILIATISFGMGINKPNVRFVIHAGVSFSIENYYQQSGRAGRDGLPAKCVLLSFDGQSNALQFLMLKGNRKMKTHKSKILNLMLAYSRNIKECRKKYMYRMLGQDFNGCNETCDICFKSPQFQSVDFTIQGTNIIEQMKSVKIPLTIIQIKEILKGKKLSKYSQYAKIFGILKQKSQSWIAAAVNQLIKQKYLAEKGYKNSYSAVRYILPNHRKKIQNITIQIQIKKQTKMTKKQKNPIFLNTHTSQEQLQMIEGNAITSNQLDPYEDEILTYQNQDSNEYLFEKCRSEEEDYSQEMQCNNINFDDLKVKNISQNQTQSISSKTNILSKLVLKYSGQSLKQLKRKPSDSDLPILPSKKQDNFKNEAKQYY